MEEIFKTLELGYIKYKNKIINVIVDNSDIIWFNAKETANALGYSNHINAINAHTHTNNRSQLQYIDYDGYAGHPHSIYLNEAGLYKLIIRSKMPSAEKFTDWVTYEVLPSVRKYGMYKMSTEHKKTIKLLNTQLKKLKTIKNKVIKENIQLRNNLKKQIFPKGGIVYVIDYSTEKDEIYRIGMTENMNKRKEIYDTHTLDRHSVVHYVETKCPRSLEWCLRGLLFNYRYMDKVDKYVCSLQMIKHAFTSCAAGSKKIECINKSKSKTSKKTITQTGGSIQFYSSKIVENKINILTQKYDILMKKIEKIDKKIYETK